MVRLDLQIRLILLLRLAAGLQDTRLRLRCDFIQQGRIHFGACGEAAAWEF